MPKVKYISSPNEIPAWQKYVLVMYGEEYAQTKHPLGVTITVARQKSKTVSELSFLTAVHTAKGIAKQEGMAEIFVCTATTPWPTPIIPHQSAVARIADDPLVKAVEAPSISPDGPSNTPATARTQSAGPPKIGQDSL
jgi:hypothetical protein